MCLRLHFRQQSLQLGHPHSRWGCPIGIGSVLKETLPGQQAANPTVTKLGTATGGKLGVFTIMLGPARKVFCPLYLSLPGGNPIDRSPSSQNWVKRMGKLPSSVMAAQEDGYLFCSDTSQEAEDCVSDLPGSTQQQERALPVAQVCNDAGSG